MYEMRGSIVPERTKEQIFDVAMIVAREFKFNRRNKKRLTHSFEQLIKYGVTLNVVEDKDWIDVTKGHFDPSTQVLSVRNTIYEQACDGDKDALFVMLHEMGHLCLSHTAKLHLNVAQVTEQMDSEWQADTFAECILEILGYQTKQLSFEFLI